MKTTTLETNSRAQALLTPNHPARAVDAATTAIRPISPNAAKLPMAVPRWFEEERLAIIELPIGSNRPDDMPARTYARYRNPVLYATKSVSHDKPLAAIASNMTFLP